MKIYKTVAQYKRNKAGSKTASLARKKAYLISTLAPASSSCFLMSSASA